jgi:PAS domain S-box-containing protein
VISQKKKKSPLRIETANAPPGIGCVNEQQQIEAALRESEERYRELFENSRDAIYVHDLSGRYLSVNRAAEELSGYSRGEIIGRHYSNFLAPQHLKNARESFCIKLDTPIETSYEAEVVCKNGTRKPVEVSSRVIMRDGRAVGIQGSVRDIRERKRAQEALQTYSHRLLEAQEAERQNISLELHDEIGQVLTAVSLNLQSMKDSCSTPDYESPLNESIRLIAEALTRIRQLSRELRPSLLDDLGLAAALRWYVARYSERSGITTEMTGDVDLGVIPQETKTACFRIAQEALANVARHARATHATVHVANQHGQLHLAVSDNGVGFEAQETLHGTSSPKALGLLWMFERALAVRGRLEINSAPGEGTRVFVNMPVVIPGHSTKTQKLNS